MKNDSDHKKKDIKVETAKALINRYRQAYKNINPEVLLNLSELKELTKLEQPNLPEDYAAQIREHLGEAESGETLRQERWHGKVKCPYCSSINIKRLAIEEQKSRDNYRYLCLSCHKEFNDDSETDMEDNIPSLHSWMFCWYLLGCNSSIQYIANKLGISLTMVEMMVAHLQKIFNAQKPLQSLMSFDEWALKHGKNYKLSLEKSLLKLTERLRGYSVTQELDTAEVRRQKKNAELHKTGPNIQRPKMR